MPGEASPFVFPSILRRLADESRLSAKDSESVAVDAQELLHWYCDNMSDGIAYECYVRSDANKADSDRLTAGNFDNLHNVHGRGWREEDVSHLIGRSFLNLALIPPSTDLFDTTEFDEPMVELLSSISAHTKGIRISNTTKLFYQKRPALVPILDSFVRQALNIPFIGGDDLDDHRAVYRLAFRRFRELYCLGNNASTVEKIHAAMCGTPQWTLGVSFSRLRIIDILAWSAVRLRIR